MHPRTRVQGREWDTHTPDPTSLVETQPPSPPVSATVSILTQHRREVDRDFQPQAMDLWAAAILGTLSRTSRRHTRNDRVSLLPLLPELHTQLAASKEFVQRCPFPKSLLWIAIPIPSMEVEAPLLACQHPPLDNSPRLRLRSDPTTPA